MKANHIRLAVVAAATALTCGIVFGQSMQEITVQGTRTLNKKDIGQTYTGATVVTISLSYGVGISGLDLTSNAGATELERRIHDAAKAACKEITRKYPDAEPNDADCAKAAAARAMVKARELESEAARKSTK
jgi:UrcA family protein